MFCIWDPKLVRNLPFQRQWEIFPVSLCHFYQKITTYHTKYQKKLLVPNLRKASSRNICNIQTLGHYDFKRQYVSDRNLGKKPFLAMGALQR